MVTWNVWLLAEKKIDIDIILLVIFVRFFIGCLTMDGIEMSGFFIQYIPSICDY